MKISIFTISDCYFSKQEKDYLVAHNLPYEEKNLEENREYLTEMLTISNNFAGTPVTKIEKDDGNIVVLKGFTKEEFNETLGIKDDVAVEPESAMPMSSFDKPAEEPTMTPPVAEPVMSAPLPAVEIPVQASAPVVTPNMDSIAAQIEQLKRLQASLAQQQAATSVVPAPVQTAVEPIVVAPSPVVTSPVASASVQTTASAPQTNMDDSLAAILAELQAKINSAQPSTPVTPPTQNQ